MPLTFPKTSHVPRISNKNQDSVYLDSPKSTGGIMSEIQIRRIFLQRDAEEIRRLQLNAPEFRKHYPQHDEWLRMAIREVVAGKRFAFGIYKTTFNEHGEPTISLRFDYPEEGNLHSCRTTKESVHQTRRTRTRVRESLI